MNLVIVESPAKTHTIGKILGDNYKVVSSKGHIRDLATTGKYGLGVDVENNFEPNYIPIKGKAKDIQALKKDIKASEMVYLATDPDREGEAISWHLYDALDIKDTNYERVVFNEITAPAVKDAFNHARKIDFDLVKSQETRRIMDRIIGFRLSKHVQKLTHNACKSAGRVQSVALKLIVDREKEIRSFIPVEYWDITAHFKEFDSSLVTYNNEKLEVHNENEVNDILNKLGEDFKIVSVEEKEKVKKGVMPFTTSTLQQAMINKYNYNSTRTMRIAQKLYEGINIGSETVGLITYMRTDSTRLSNIFTSEAFKYIEETYGEKYKGAYKTSKKTENVQDAHEAIRPTSIYRTPESMKKYLSDEEYKLYSIVYARALASLMADAKVKATTVLLDNNNYGFKANGQVLLFDGYLKVYNEYSKSDDVILPDMSKFNGVVSTKDIETEQKFTKPVSRYTEASLIKEMEELGIGRPSTYATTMEILKNRKYVDVEDKKFVPTKNGFSLVDKLDNSFSDIINVNYTATMETDLDEIADAKIDNVKLLRDFYNLLNKLIDDDDQSADELEVMGTCPECGSDLVQRYGRFGSFIACSNYPECKYIHKEETEDKEDVTTNVMCPVCHDGYFVKREAKRGRGKGNVFYGCSNYPKCKTLFNDEPTNELCPDCNSLMLKDKDGNLYCSNKCNEPKDDYIPVECPKCHKGHMVKKTAARGKNAGNEFYACDNYPKCKNAISDKPIDICSKCGDFLVEKEDKIICLTCDKEA